MKPIDTMNPWELLGLAPGATADEIRRAYERLSSRLAPGSLPLYSIAEREEQLDVQQRLRAAYAELLSGLGSEEPPPGAQAPAMRPMPSPSTAESSASLPLADGAPAMQPPVAAPATEFTGDFLRRFREGKGISLETLSHRTRIRRMLLESLEAERFDTLPERVFVRGFVLAVARELGLDAERVWDGYGRRWEAWASAKH